MHVHRGGWGRRVALWLVLVLSTIALSAVAAGFTPQTVPNPRPATQGHVSDPDGLLTAADEARINQLLGRLEADTGVQVAVVTVNRIQEPADEFGFSQQLFNLWGLGDARRDDGLLVLLVKDQRRIRFHTGYGLEGDLPDVLCARIQKAHMIPRFRDRQYGEGLWAGLLEVDQVLREARNVRPNPRGSESRRAVRWETFRNRVLTFYGGFIVIVLLARVRSGYFRPDAGSDHPVPPAMRLSWRFWVVGYVVLPLGILALFESGAVYAADPVWACLGVLYGHFALLALDRARRLHAHARALLAQQAFGELDTLMRQQRSAWAWTALLLPLPFLFYLPYIWSRPRHYRDHVRTCPACAHPMRRLTESEEDAHLDAARQCEERLWSLDHDVWACTACPTVRAWAYPGLRAVYQDCPACQARALVFSKDTVVRPARSRGQKGLLQRDYVCRFCSHVKTEDIEFEYRIRGRSVPSPFGGGGGSGGGGWGGGSSGGGGATGSW